MKIAVINPNTTASMTKAIGRVATAVAAPGTEILAVTSAAGPASIEGPYDGALAVPGLLREIAKAEEAGVAAHVIACFDDTGLDAARSATANPVIGIGEAAFHAASLICHRFTVVTTLSRSIPVIERNLTSYGLTNRCLRVRAAETPVLAFDEEPETAEKRVAQEIETALLDDHAEAIVLGCAGMADLADTMSARFGIPVIDGVRAAVTLAEALVRMRLMTAKTGAYAPPTPKAYVGLSQ